MSCLLAGLMAAIPSYAFELEFFDGDLTVEIGNELNYGVSISTQKASKRYIYGLPPGQNPISFTAAQATQRQIDNGDPVVPMRDQIVVGNGGRAGLASLDDGRLAYSRGVYQNQARGITDIKSNWGDFGARVKLLYFYDTEFVDEKRNIHPGTKQEVTTSSRVNRLMGRDLTTREMFAYWDGYVGDIPITVRVGDQVISWGQSQFAPGIDQINPLDINNLLIPSLSPSNAREPIGMALINVVPTDWLSLEAFYQYDRAIIGAPPAGTFFSLADVAGAGVSDFAGLGRLCAVTTTDAPYDSDGALSPFGAPGACTPLQETWFPDSGGQFGLNVGFQLPFIPMLSSFQFNAYYVRHHARVPIIGARKSGIIPNAVPCTTTRAALVISPDDEGRRFGQALSSTTGGDAQDPAWPLLLPRPRVEHAVPRAGAS